MFPNHINIAKKTHYNIQKEPYQIKPETFEERKNMEFIEVLVIELIAFELYGMGYTTTFPEALEVSR